MNDGHNDIDKLARELLNKSLVKPVSSNFDDRLMDKIRLAPAPSAIRSNGKSIKKAWIFWMMAVAFLLISVLIVANNMGSYFSDARDLFRVTIIYILYGGLALFIPLILYQFDALIQLLFWKRNDKVSIN